MTTPELLSELVKSDRDRAAFFDTTRFVAHGHSVFRRRLAAGKSYTVSFTQETPADSTDLPTLWTEGRILAPENGLYPDRVAGSFSKGRSTPYPAGTYTYVVAEDSEWWCAPSCMSIVSLISIPSTGESSFPSGTLGMVCSGSLSFGGTIVSAGEPFVIGETPRTGVAGEDAVYGFIFERAATA